MLANHWHVAAPSARVGRRPVPVRVGTHPVVLFRDANRHAHALSDRCAHRGVPLSLATTVDGTLRCRYHGWRYAGNGACVEVPSLPEGTVPRGCGVGSFPCVEQDGYVWIFVGDREPSAGPQPIAEFTSQRWWQGTLDVACSWEAAIENNLDWCHPAFAHPWTHPQFFARRFRGPVTQTYELRTDHRSVTAFSGHEGNDAADPVTARTTLVYELPDRVTVRLRGGRQVIVMHIVATSADSCRVEWLTSRTGFGRRVRYLRHSWPFDIIFRQDQRILEAAHRRNHDTNAPRERSVPADASTLAARKLIQHHDDTVVADPIRRTISVRA